MNQKLCHQSSQQPSQRPSQQSSQHDSGNDNDNGSGYGNDNDNNNVNDNDNGGDGRHLILWDRDCGFCRRSIMWVREHDRHQRFRDVPFQDAPSPPMTPALYEACKHAVHVIERHGAVLRAGRAVLFILRELGWRKLGIVLGWPPFVWAVEWGYRWVARHRALASRILFRR